jgi:hypothetical protein
MWVWLQKSGKSRSTYDAGWSSLVARRAERAKRHPALPDSNDLALLLNRKNLSKRENSGHLTGT